MEQINYYELKKQLQEIKEAIVIFYGNAITKQKDIRVGEIYDIVVMGMPVYFVQLVAIKKFRYYELTDMESFIDLGIPLTEYRQYLMKYLPANIDLKTQEFYFCLFEHVTPGKEIMDEPKFNQNHKSKIVNQQS